MIKLLEIIDEVEEYDVENEQEEHKRPNVVGERED